MISVTNVIYDTDGQAIDLPTSFSLPNSTVRSNDPATIADRITKAIEGDWLVESFDYERPGDDAPTHHRDPWVGSPHHLAVKASIAAYEAGDESAALAHIDRSITASMTVEA